MNGKCVVRSALDSKGQDKMPQNEYLVSLPKQANGSENGLRNLIK